jgi:hypothetical protein
VFFPDDFAGELENFVGLQTGLGGFAGGLGEESVRGVELGFAAAVMATLGDEGAETLAAIDDPFAFEFLIGAFDGDDADEEILGELAE